jgi:hypothetical protein
LAADLKGTLEENNLESLSINWNDARQIIKDRNSTPDSNAGGVKIYDWNITDLTPATTATFRTKFAEAAQGLHSIVLEATDTANNTTRIAWMFNKDTQGPEISVNSIRRVIKHPTIPANATVFPSSGNSAWPSDWPHGPNWIADTTWTTFRTDYGVNNWPSEYAFYTDDSPSVVSPKTKEQKVIDALTAENGRTVSVISGAADEVFMKGTFSDALSDIWLNPTNHPYFYSRFNNGVRSLTLAPSNTDGWIRKEVEPLTGGRYNSADWIIPIPLTIPGSTIPLPDGEHSFDIKVADIAGNWAELFDLRFIVDRNDPVLAGYNATGGSSGPLPVPEGFKVDGIGENKPLSETERVFSAANVSTTGTTPVFLLKGFVSDNNLSEIFVVISTENATGTPYRVESTLNIANPTTSVDKISGGSTPPADPPSFSRLSAIRTPTTTSNEWEWTLRIPEKDIAALRSQAGTNDGTRRYITVTGTDKANRKVGPLRWNF